MLIDLHIHEIKYSRDSNIFIDINKLKYILGFII